MHPLADHVRRVTAQQMGSERHKHKQAGREWASPTPFLHGLPDMPDEDRRAAIQQQVLAWFGSNARDLPWRRTRDPYRVVVAEVMLQQTQVERVLPRYAAFLEAFPTLEALAAAPAAEVIRLWAGLGYNRRAVNLQRLARMVCEEYGGEFPRATAELQKLPAIGPYTAGALACFAFGQDVAFLDTNIRRVVRHCLVGPDDTPTTTPVKDRLLLPLAQALIPPGRGWEWNQAIMELGALVCTSAAPRCEGCPLRGECRAAAAWSAQQESEHPDSYTYEQARPRPLRRVAERQQPFVGSNRYYRGRLVALLREHPPGALLPLAQAGPQIKADYTAEDDRWLQALVEGLARDGLVERVDDAVRLAS